MCETARHKVARRLREVKRKVQDNARPTASYLAHRMAATPTQPHTPQMHDSLVLALLRAGHSPDEIYVLLWPTPDTRPVSLPAFRAMAQALDVAESTAEPAEQLTEDLEEVVDNLHVARRKIMQAIESNGDLDEMGGFDAGPHMALVKNADTLLKYQAARQDRQVHKLNLRVAREKARLELLNLYERGPTN